MRLRCALPVLISLLAALASQPARAAEQPRTVEAVDTSSVRDPPPPGRVLFGLGVFGIVAGVAKIGAGAAVLILEPGDSGVFGSIPLAFGVTSLVLGAVGTHYGRRRMATLERWEDEAGLELEQWRAAHPNQGPPPGLGLIVGGSVLAGASLTALTFGAVAYAGDTRTARIGGRPLWPGLTLAVGTVTTVTAAMLIGAGGARAHEHRRRHGRSVTLVPTPWFGARSVGLGLAGTFRLL